MGYAVNGYCYENASNAVTAFNSSNLSYYATTNAFLSSYFYPPDQQGNIRIHVTMINPYGKVSDVDTGRNVPLCTQEGSIQEMFDPSNLNPVDVVNAIGSGFILIALPLSVAWAGRRFVKAIFH